MPKTLSFSVPKATRHLNEADKTLAKLIKQHGPYTPRIRTTDHYGTLVSSIIGQQLSGKAASTIRRRFFALYGDEETPPAPEQILKTHAPRFRAVGVSAQKREYLKDLSRHVVDGRIDFNILHAMPDDEIMAHLTEVKGIGEWTVHMFLMFHLGRPNVLPVGDLGVRKGMVAAYGLRKLPSPRRMHEIAKPWEPYRSVGSWYMWKVVDTTLPA